jgi:8-oxo-dGTP pyrophosphatase MutT (NUDIX family)
LSWKTTESQLLARTPVFSLRRDRRERSLPGGARDCHDFFILETVDWVNVVPLTSEREIVFIEIHRHGIDGPSLEIPGGMIDADDRDPAAAGAREMLEETGYHSDRIVPLGVVHPNPAIQGNRCFTYLAEDARLVSAPRLDETEEIRVVRHPVSEVPRLLADGKITHALVVAALSWFFQREGLPG